MDRREGYQELGENVDRQLSPVRGLSLTRKSNVEGVDASTQNRMERAGYRLPLTGRYAAEPLLKRGLDGLAFNLEDCHRLHPSFLAGGCRLRLVGLGPYDQ